FVLMGSTCGAELWADRWTIVRDTFQTKLHDAGIILDVRDVLSELENIRTALETKWRPIVDQLHAHQMHFKGTMGRLYNRLQHAAARPDHSVVVENKRWPIDGWAYFTTDNGPQLFRLALHQIDAAIAAGYGKETELRVRTVTIGEARDRLDAIAHAA